MDLSLIDSSVYKNESDKVIAYTAIADIFVAESDMWPIFDFCYDKHARVTFREAGIKTINQLKRGAAAKSHDILEKSIQLSRLKDPDIKALIKIVGKEKLDLILGLVGRWKSKKHAEEEQGRLKGIYTAHTNLSEFPSIFDKYKDIIKPPNPFKKGKRQKCIVKLALTMSDEISMRKYVVNKAKDIEDPEHRAFLEGPYDGGNPTYYISNKLTVKFLQDLVDEEKGDIIAKHLVAGDYDLHDMFKNYAIAEGSEGEKKLIDGLNECISKSGHRLGTIQDKAHLMIQHGAQEKYVAHMMNSEKGQPIVEAVANICPDMLAACTPKGWRLVQGFEELKQIYEEAGLKIKASWDPSVREEKKRAKAAAKERNASKLSYAEVKKKAAAVKNKKRRNSYSAGSNTKGGFFG